MQINQELILRLEELARLELSEQEREKIRQDLENILAMCQTLEELDTEHVAPLVYISEEINVLRSDEVKHQVDRQSALANAPDTDGTYFKVPKVIDK